MTMYPFDAELDLSIERVVPLAPEAVWAAWTTPELLMHWFTPAPWTVTSARVALYPGGEFFTMMRSPEGSEHPMTGCILEVIHARRLVFTDALLPGFRPAPTPFMTGIITMDAEGDGCRYRAVCRHANAATRQRHIDMGFEAGWNAALDQLVALMQAQPTAP